MKIEYILVDKLVPYERNAKKHPRDQIERIAASLREFGFRQNLVVDKNNVVVVGHGRLEAAKLLGLDKVPCERVDDLTEDQIRAYRLVDNRVAEGEIDLEIELDELENIDMDLTDFGLDIDDISGMLSEAEAKHEQYKQATQEDVLNICNLAKGQFPGAGDYDIPILSPVFDLPPIKEWIGFNYVLSDKDPTGKAVHFFVDDYQFERLWNRPEQYVDKLRQYVCVATPDFSPYGDMPHALQIYNHYRKHWVGAWLQEHGVTVIPTIRCSTDPRSLKWYLDGEPEGGIVIMSSMWTGNDETADISRKEYETMKRKLKPCKTIIYGGYQENMGIKPTDNVEYIKKFTDKRWGE